MSGPSTNADMTTVISIKCSKSLAQHNVIILILQTLTGNTDQDTVVRNEVRVFEAKYLRFRPQTWNERISMRVEVYGCPQSK